LSEPSATAIVLLAIGSLLLLSALGTRLSGRTGLPVPLVFLGIGVLAGSQGVGGIDFENYRLAFRLGTTALALILFDGGLNTSLSLVRRWYKPASVLATLGVVLTAAVVMLAARLFGLSWAKAALVGAVVSSTDAAAVFAALRASGVQLKKRVGLTLELESGVNDPMAIILTMTVTNVLVAEGSVGWETVLYVPLQIGIGGALGLVVGACGRWVLTRARLSVSGLYPVMTVALALVAFSVPTLLQGSGFLAVYLAAMVLGDGKLPYRAGVVRVHDALAWFAQVGMFLLLGLLVFPGELLSVALPGIGLALVLAVVARPIAVALCLLPFRFPTKEMIYVGWVGLRGAVPIILATFPVIAGVDGAREIFNLVFFIVLVNVLVPGATLGWVTRRLGLESREPEAPVASLEIATTHDLAGEIVAFHIGPASAVAGQELVDVPFPPAAAAMLVIRGRELIAPRGTTRLEPGDHVYVFCSPKDRGLLQLLFGQQESE
jgi:cell volume regulation protein A